MQWLLYVQTEVIFCGVKTRTLGPLMLANLSAMFTLHTENVSNSSRALTVVRLLRCPRTCCASRQHETGSAAQLICCNLFLLKAFAAHQPCYQWEVDTGIYIHYSLLSPNSIYQHTATQAQLLPSCCCTPQSYACVL